MPSEPAATTVPDPVVAVIPAAGSGSRFARGAAGRAPKQYAELEGQCLLERSVRRMLEAPDVERVVVALASGDVRFAELPVAADVRVTTVTGGTTRSTSVAAALARVRREHGDRAWALVHDAARPLVHDDDVRALLDAVRSADAAGRAVGGILAVRVTDTLKRERAVGPQGADRPDGTAGIEATVPRDGLWRAQTPQLFRAGPLADALEAAHEGARSALATGAAPTDEASVMEGAGTVLLVEARSPNPKITRPGDLALAQALLAADAGATTGATTGVGAGVGADGGTMDIDAETTPPCA